MSYIKQHNHALLIYVKLCNNTVMGVMIMGNIVPSVGGKPTSRAFRVSLLPVHHIISLMSPLYPCLPIYASPCPRGQCRLFHSSAWNCKSCNAYNYNTCRQGSYIFKLAHSAELVQEHGQGYQCHGLDENGEYYA